VCYDESNGGPLGQGTTSNLTTIMTNTAQTEKRNLDEEVEFYSKAVFLLAISAFVLTVIGLSTWWMGVKITIGILAALTLPIVLGGSSLIVTINTRHTSIADRIRSLSDRHYSITNGVAPEPAPVLESIKKQLELFANRFSCTLMSLSLAYLAIIFQTLSITLLVLNGSTETANRAAELMPSAALEFRLIPCTFLSTLSCILAISTLILALIFACVDTLLSVFTLQGALSAAGENVAMQRDTSDQITEVNISLIPLFTQRYQELMDVKITDLEKFAVSYFRFQKEQYRYATWNLFPRRIFTYWMQLRRTEANNETLIGNSEADLRELWDLAKKTSDFDDSKNDFVVLMDQVLDVNNAERVSEIVVRAMQEAKGNSRIIPMI